MGETALPQGNFLWQCEGRFGKIRLIMKSKKKRKAPEIILRHGKPAAVILDIAEYREMLERLEDIEDLKTLKAMRKRPLKFRTLEDFLQERRQGA
jgi:prevent-host-death family protein